MNADSPWTVTRWLARLSLSFLIVALIVGWDVRREYVITHAITGRMAANIALAGLCAVLAIVGTALRHRRRNDSDKSGN